MSSATKSANKWMDFLSHLYRDLKTVVENCADSKVN